MAKITLNGDEVKQAICEYIRTKVLVNRILPENMGEVTLTVDAFGAVEEGGKVLSASIII